MPRHATKPKAAKRGKQIFKNWVFVLTGDFNLGEAGGSKTHENITRWISVHGGVVESEVKKSTDYLVSTLDHFKKKVDAVHRALTLGTTIVTYDWIEDCLLHAKGPKLISDKKYRLQAAEKRITKAKKEAVRHKEAFEKDVIDLNDIAPMSQWKVYWDSEYLKHEIILTRVDSDDLTKNEKYILYLFETIDIPKYYTFAARLFRNNRQVGTYSPIPYGGTSFMETFEKFRHFFHSKTGIEWDERCDELPAVEGKFRYAPPTGGKPRGVLPLWWLSPEEKERLEDEAWRRSVERDERMEEQNPRGWKWLKQAIDQREMALERNRVEEEKNGIEVWLSSYDGKVG